MATIAWHDLRTKYIITNVGTTLPGAPLLRRRTVLEAAADPQQAALCTSAFRNQLLWPMVSHSSLLQTCIMIIGKAFLGSRSTTRRILGGSAWLQVWRGSVWSMRTLRTCKFDVEQRRQDPEDYFTFCHRVAYQLVNLNHAEPQILPSQASEFLERCTRAPCDCDANPVCPMEVSRLLALPIVKCPIERAIVPNKAALACKKAFADHWRLSGNPIT